MTLPVLIKCQVYSSFSHFYTAQGKDLSTYTNAYNTDDLYGHQTLNELLYLAFLISFVAIRVAVGGQLAFMSLIFKFCKCFDIIYIAITLCSMKNMQEDR